jgi:hypothetical protein
MELLTGAGNDSVGVLSTAGPTAILTGGGNDLVSVVPPGALGAVLGGPLAVDLGGGSNTLGVNESADPAGDVLAVGPDQVQGTGPQPFTINYAASGGTVANLAVVGGLGADTFNVTPSIATTYSIDGGPPTEPAPGDTINVNLAGTTGAMLSGLTQNGDEFSGTYTFSNRAAVSFTGMDSFSPLLDPAPSVSLAFGPAGAVLEVVSPTGVLTQFDAAGAHVLGGGVRAASVAFSGGSEVLLVTYLDGRLVQFDAAGAHLLGGGVLSASVAFGPAGAVLEVVSFGGTLTQFDAAGAHVLGSGFTSASVAFGPTGEVLVTVNQGGVATQLDASGAHPLLGGVVSAAVATAPDGTEVLDVIFANGLLEQFDATGAHVLGKVF